MKISIIGTGYIGLIQAVGLSKLGFKVTALDVFQDKIDKLNSGISTIYEEGLDLLLEETYKKINFTTNTSDITGSDIIFLCVGTPQDETGKTDLGYIFSACNDIKSFLSGNEIIVIKSTVPVGTNKKVYETLDRKNHVVSNPEFLREGLAIYDFFTPDRIIFGFKDTKDKKTIDKINKVYKYFVDKEVPILMTDWQTAELIKYSANSFLATKISFINEISRLADKVDANIKDISVAIGMDVRIGKHFLNAGIGYGGSCFPKDVKSLIHQFKENNLEGHIISKVDDINTTQVNYFMDKIYKHYNNNLHGKTIGVLGVAFKPGTDDLRESKGIELIKKLMYVGVRLKIYDYNIKALKNFKKYLEGVILGDSRGFFEVEIVNSFDELVNGIDSLVITIEDKKILTENFKKVKLRDNIIFDGKNMLIKENIKKLGFKYIGIGY